MKLTPIVMKKIENFSKKYYKKNEPGHQLEHMYRTLRIAKHLARKEGAEKRICEAAALLHDIAQTSHHAIHEKQASKLSRKFLKELNVDEDIINRICHAIECHCTHTLHNAKTIEDKIVYDADKLQMLVPTGIAKSFAFRFYIKKMLPHDAVIDMQKMQKRVYKHLQTKTAKQIAKKYYTFMKKFWELHKEFDKMVR
ncbi:MAG: HD domain-containing protein [Candidatus Hodarchaeales archaeon]|jgi:uncharacterized protein